MLNNYSQVPLNPLGLALLYPAGMSIGTRLRQLRESKGWNQDELGERMGNVSKRMVSQWENDQGTPTTERLLLLREHIDFSFDWLLSDQSVYTTRDPKLVAVLHALEDRPEYVKDAAVKAVLTNCELADQAKSNGTDSHG